MIGELAFEVATYRALPDASVLERAVSWLFEEYERISGARWSETQRQIAAVQLGTMRALALALGTKNLPDLPEYEDVVASIHGKGDNLPAWHRKFEKANPDRAKRIGLSAAKGSPP